MECVHTFITGRHKHQADITLLFQYTNSKSVNYCLELGQFLPTKFSYFPPSEFKIFAQTCSVICDLTKLEFKILQNLIHKVTCLLIR